MEAAIITVLSVFAFIGIINTIYYIFRQLRPKNLDSGMRLILYLPHNAGSKLEYIIRQIFFEELPKKIMASGKVYVLVPPEDEKARSLLEHMKDLYPIEVLPDQAAYCMITEREKSNEYRQV